jgi:hypothetical protein
MLDHVAMTENWSRPWHSLQRSLAGELSFKPEGAAWLEGMSPINSWLTRARGESTPAAATNRQ